jgi:hypothetical protein
MLSVSCITLLLSSDICIKQTFFSEHPGECGSATMRIKEAEGIDAALAFPALAHAARR